MEFISDLHPHASLVPIDPLQKARARVFASFIDTVLLQALADTSFFGTKDISELYKVLDFVQSQLLDDAQYAVGNDFTIADVVAAAIFSMVEVVLSNDVGKYDEGEGLKVYDAFNSARYDKLRGYVKRILNRESVKRSIDTVSECPCST